MNNTHIQKKDHVSRFNGFLSDRLGLEFPSARFGDLESKLADAAREAGFPDTETFIEHILSSPPSVERMEKIASLLTNGETYFWREPLIFDALAKRILPELIQARRASDRCLRIWSAGCSSGEEPYSIAIALRSAIPDLDRWRVTILATDINIDSLRKASIGVYGEWSFRNASASFVERNFRSRKDGKREILPEIRDMVTFARLNLAEDPFPSPANGTDSIDIVFCRNVLMYFSSERAVAVGGKIYDSLVDGGWLLVGASELSQFLFPRFQSVRIGDVFAYRKTKESIRVSEIELPHKAEFIWPDPILSFPDKNPTPAATVPETPAEKAPEERPSINVMALARALADRGDLDDALALCEKALSSDKLDPSLHYLKAAVLQEMGRTDDAFRSLERTLYVDPEFVLAHFTLGNLAMRKGDRKTGTRCFRNALALVEPLSDSDVLPESAGLAVGRFREIVRSVMHGGVSE